MITVLSLLYKNCSPESLTRSFLGGPSWVGPWAPKPYAMFPSLLSMPGRFSLTTLSPSSSRDRIRTLWKGHVLTMQKIQAISNIRPTVQKTNPCSTSWLEGPSHREGFSPHKDWYHGVREESCHSQQGFHSERLHFQLPKSSCRQLLM